MTEVLQESLETIMASMHPVIFYILSRGIPSSSSYPNAKLRFLDFISSFLFVLGLERRKPTCMHCVAAPFNRLSNTPCFH